MLIEKLHALTSSRLAVVDFDATVQDGRPFAFQAWHRARRGVQRERKRGRRPQQIRSRPPSHRPDVQAPPVSALMSRSIVTCSPQDDVHDVWQTMAARSLQNIPVIDDGARPLGILDIRDAMKALFEEEEMQERMLFNYVTGVGYR